ncbi:NAD(P)/FAD-dependent oxidoreductase [uncultured Endozoicomonas sp.]|uniref:NAD(P)-binding domain-containing protein n=1 Tax=uncultured Endozoicomonas sp. TaxID=432652 RepID=UPI00262A0BEE|nr:NAD(P)/FAD-dependent oxidoreductase [uncultured Endozoicomonas sp.]
MTKVAIIGAGPSGLSLMLAFRAAQQNGDSIPDIVCFEKQEAIGGQWNFSWRTGVDPFGEPVHSSMYKHIWSNGPKECLEYPDYTFEDHFGHATPSFPPRQVITDYLCSRATKGHIDEWIRFNHVVRWVEYLPDEKTFAVSYHDLVNDHQTCEHYDYLVVATGHFSTPSIPDVEGMDDFSGSVIHAHDFRDARHYQGQRVLIVGGSYSAEDIGSQCCKFGAEQIITSSHKKLMQANRPDHWQLKPILTKLSDDTVQFQDGTTANIDSIILCTGYRHHFPFLEESLRLKTRNRLWIPNLYWGVCCHWNPQLMYLGMQDQSYSFTMFDAQAWFVRDVISGKRSLPSLEEMQRHTLLWLEKEKRLETDEEKIRFQGNYLKELIQQTNYPSIEIEAINRMLIDFMHNAHWNILGYRDKNYASVMTGNPSPSYRLKWFENMTDEQLDLNSSN